MDAEQLAKRALEEHQRLNTDIKYLVGLLNSKPENSQAEWFAACRDSFRHFHTQLRTHIEVEELDGFMRPVCERRPTLTPVLDRLLKEHHDMLARCTVIEQFLCAHRETTEKNCARAQDDVRALLADLERHEAAENKLLQEVFNRDIGTGD